METREQLACKKQNKRLLRLYARVILSSVGLVAMFLLSACGSGSGVLHNGTPTGPTVTPSPTVDAQKTQEAAYAKVVAADSSQLSGDFTKTGTDCSNQDLTSCRADMVAVQTDVQKMQNDLNGVTVPQCIAQGDRDLRTALQDFNQGATAAISGIDNSDAHEVQDGATLIEQGSSTLTSASTEIQNAHC